VVLQQHLTVCQWGHRRYPGVGTGIGRRRHRHGWSAGACDV